MPITVLIPDSDDIFNFLNSWAENRNLLTNCEYEAQ